MKKLIFIFMISILALTNIKAEIDSETKSKIKYAIEKSKPNELEEILKQVELTQQEKADFIATSEAVLKIRNEKRLLNLVKPKPGPQPGLFMAGVFIEGSIGAIALLATIGYKAKRKLLHALGSATLAGLLFWSARNSYKRAEEEAMRPYRTRDRKWLDALEVNRLLKKGKI